MKNDKKRQILFLVSLIGIILVILTMGTTFAYQTLIVDYKEGSDNNIGLNSGNLDISYTAGNKIEFKNIPLSNNYNTADYTEFKVENKNSSVSASYMINLINLEYSEELITSDFKYTLVLIDGDSKSVIGSGDFSSLNGTSISLNFNIGQYRNLDKGNSETIRLYLWVKETENDQNNLKNISFKGNIEINSIFTSEVDGLKNLSIKGNSVQDNLYNIATNEYGMYYNNSGNYVKESTQFISDYILVDSSIEYNLYGISYATGNFDLRINYFNENKTWISNEVINISMGTVFSKNITIPENIKYVRISFLKESDNSIKFYRKDGKITSNSEVEIKNLGTKIEDKTSENYGKYEIPIKINNSKNLLNVSDGTLTLSNSYYTTHFYSSVLLEPSTTYTLSFNYTINSSTENLSTAIGYGTTNYRVDIIYGKEFPNQTSGRQVVTFTTPSTFSSSHIPYFAVRFIRANLSATANVNISNVQLEIGSSATDYVPYIKPVTYNVYLNEPLRKVGDYADYIDYASGKLVRNIKNEYLTNVTAKSGNTGTYSVFLTDISEKPLVKNPGTANSVGYAMSNKFDYTTTNYRNLNYNANVIQTYITTGKINRIAYTFDDSTIKTIDLAQQKIGEGFDVQYVMAESKIENVNLPSLGNLTEDSIITVCSSNNVCASD